MQYVHVLKELNWLPVRRRVNFKMTTLHGLLITVRPAWLQLTWPPTVSWYPTKVVVSCALPIQGHVSSEGLAAAIETDALLLQVLSCGTVCQLI